MRNIWRLIVIAFVVVLLPLYFTHNAYAQAGNIDRQTKKDFDRAYQDYLIKMEDYKKAHELYISAKAQYLRSKTQKSESTLMDVGNSVLKLRDEVIIYHLDMVMKKYLDTDGATDDTANRLQTKVDEEVKWYQNHILALPSANNLDDLTQDSADAQSRKKSNTDKLAYEIILNVAYATTQDYSARFNELLTQFSQKFDVIRADTREGFAFDSKKTQTIDKYIDEMEIIINRSNDKRSSIYQDITKATVKDQYDYNYVIKSLIEAVQYEKDATFKLIETIVEVKTQEVK